MSAIAAATQHVVAMLKASPEVRALLPHNIQEGIADEKAVMPYVLVQTFGDALDVNGDGGYRSHTPVSLSVRVVMKAKSLGDLRAHAKAVDRALQATSGTYTDKEGDVFEVVSCVRFSEQNLSELAAGGVVRYLGGIYDLVVS